MPGGMGVASRSARIAGLVIVFMLVASMVAPLPTPALAGEETTKTASSLVEVLNTTLASVISYLKSRGVPENSTAWSLVEKASKLIVEVEKTLEQGDTKEAWRLAQEVFRLLARAVQLAQRGATAPPRVLLKLRAEARSLESVLQALRGQILRLESQGLLPEENATLVLEAINTSLVKLRELVEELEDALAGLVEVNITKTVEAVREAKKVAHEAQKLVRQAALKMWAKRLVFALQHRIQALQKVEEKLRARMEEALKNNATSAAEALGRVLEALESYEKLLEELASRIEEGNLTINDLKTLFHAKILAVALGLQMHTLHSKAKLVMVPVGKPELSKWSKMMLEKVVKAIEKAVEKLREEAKRLEKRKPKLAETLEEIASNLEKLASILEALLRGEMSLEEAKTAVKQLLEKLSKEASSLPVAVKMPVRTLLLRIGDVLEDLRAAKQRWKMRLMLTPGASKETTHLALVQLHRLAAILRAWAPALPKPQAAKMLEAAKTLDKAAAALKHGDTGKALELLEKAKSILESLAEEKLPPLLHRIVALALQLVENAIATVKLAAQPQG